MKASTPRGRAGSATRARQRGFFDFSFGELAIIFGVALVVLGPKKLPGLVAQVGRWVGRARMMARQFRDQWEQEVNQIQSIKPVPYRAPNPAPAPPGGTQHVQPASSGAQPQAATAATAATAADAPDAAAQPGAEQVAGAQGAPEHTAGAGPQPPEPGAGYQGTLDLGESVPQFELQGTQPVVVQPYAAAAAETAGAAPADAAAVAAGVAPAPAVARTAASAAGGEAAPAGAPRSKVVFPPDHE
ncbi:MAG TPA: twin-arginine translocase TatA/TatE family subunit [Steroidobacteraceae bacterium]|nr:twin-arginine translocase TatA/TatE family subunit [Steroidobacteraceae bacterium]